MNFLVNIFNILLYQPLFNLLVLLYKFLPIQDFGLAIIALTLLIRIALYPVVKKGIEAQKALAVLQPKIKEIQRKYKDDRQRQLKEMMELYKKHKISPFSGLFPLFLQLPILIALYRVFFKGLNPDQLTLLYSFVPNPGKINPLFLGRINLGQASISLALLAGLCQFFQTKMFTNKKRPKNLSQKITRQMSYFFPFLTVIILFKLPSAVALYWLVSSLFALFQQIIVMRKKIHDQSA